MSMACDGSLKLETEHFSERSILFKQNDFSQAHADAIALSKDDYLVGNLIVHDFEVVRELKELNFNTAWDTGLMTYAKDFIAVPRFCIKNFPFIVCSDYRQGQGFYLVNVREATIQHLVKCSASYSTDLYGFFI